MVSLLFTRRGLGTREGSQEGVPSKSFLEAPSVLPWPRHCVIAKMWSNENPHLESINGSFSSLGLTCSFFVFLKKPVKQWAHVFNCLVALVTCKGSGILQKLPLGELEVGAACYLSAVSFWNLPAAYYIVVGGTSE